MSFEQWKDIKVVVYLSDPSTCGRMEQRLRLPQDAEFSEFLETLKDESPSVYEEVRRRVLRAAGRVLAYGRQDPLLTEIDRKVLEGGTLVFPATEDDLAPSHNR
jgi:hypothetical protein